MVVEGLQSLEMAGWRGGLLESGAGRHEAGGPEWTKMQAHVRYGNVSM